MEDRTRSNRARPSRNTSSTKSASSTTKETAYNLSSEKPEDININQTFSEGAKGNRRTIRNNSTSTATPSASTASPHLIPSSPKITSSTSNQLIASIGKPQSRRSNTSEHSSALSQSGTSTHSSPATPATSHSITTNVPSSSSLSTQRGKRVKDSPESAATGLQSSSKHTGSSRQNKGKARESDPSSGTITATPSKGKKRALSLSPPPVDEETPARKTRKSEPTISSSKYSLRSRGTKMTSNKTSSLSSSAEGSIAPSATKGKTNLAKGKHSKTTKRESEAAATSSSCALDSDMDVNLKEASLTVSKDSDEGDDDERFGEEQQEDDEEEAAEGLNEGMEEDEEDEEVGGEGEEDAEARHTLEMGEEDEDEEDEDEDGHYDDEMGDPYGDSSEGGGGLGSHLRAMAGFMSGLPAKFRTLLASIRNRKNPAAQLEALQELAEILSISNEDTLAGYFPTESFVTELIYLMGGPKPPNPITGAGESSKQKKEREAEEAEDDEMAAAIAAASGLEDNGEKMLLACRCLANLIEAMPYAAHSVVSLGAVPVLNSKLMEIEFIDLAEQVLLTLEKISGEYPSAIVREDGLAAMLQYLDFFNIHVQRTAMNAAANCCRRLGVDSIAKVKDVMPIIKNVLSYSDQRLVESACRCIVRLVDSFRHQGEILEQLLTDELVASINAILLPASTSVGSTSTSSTAAASTSVNTATYTDVLKALGIAARVSPKTAVTLLENNVVETLYHLLTGSPAPGEDGLGGKGPAASSSVQADLDNAGAAVAVMAGNGNETVADADVAVLQNLAHRPKEQVQEALSLVAELLPPLPRSGVFDPRMYTERAYLKRKSKLAKAAKLAKKGATAKNNGISNESLPMEKTTSEDSIVEAPPQVEQAIEVVVPQQQAKSEKVKSDRELAKEQAQAKRVHTLKGRQGLVKRFTQLVLPTLVEVYAASVSSHVRSKALFGILKIVSFVEAEPLMQALDNVALASFIAAILSSRDHPTLVQGALQLVEMLTTKLPNIYSALFRREGVMWEIEDIASREPSGKTGKEKEKSKVVGVASGANAEATPVNVVDGGGFATQSTAASTTVTTSSLPTSDLSRLLAGAGVHDIGRLAGRLPASGTIPTSAPATSANATLLSVTGQPLTLAEAEDSNIWRARILRDQFSPEASKASSGGADEAGRALNEIRELVEELNTKATIDQNVAEETLGRTARLFAKADNPISSFEVLRSGMVDGLYNFATGDSKEMPRNTRRLLLSQALMQRQGQDSGAMTAASALVRRLQETLSRLENVEITTAINSAADEARRSPTANVARQIRLKLVADNEEGDIPRNCNNLIVSIHAITSFQSLNDYLRPKIAASQAMSSMAGATSASDGALGSGSSQLSGVLAAFASSAGFEMYPSLRNSLAAAAAKHSASTTTSAATSSNKDQKAVLPSSSSEGKQEGESSSVQAGEGSQKGKDASETKEGQTSKRRSSRLSARSGEETNKEEEETAPKAKEDNVEDNEEGMDEALARRLVEGLLQDEMEGLEDENGFTDDDEEDDYDEEVIDEGAMPGMEPSGTSADRTINLNVVPDGSKVEAKTPDGTRVATPINELSRSAPATHTPSTPIATTSNHSPTKASYASALQKRPTDWHLKFEMEGNSLSLDSTIYSAIHNFEMQKVAGNEGAGSSIPTRFIWSNTYTVKYRKVAGPAPSSSNSKEKEAMVAKDSSMTQSAITTTSSLVQLPDSIAEDAPYAQILKLLRVLYDVNCDWKAESGNATLLTDLDVNANGLMESSFVNNKLTAKLNRQLEEPMIVASNCMPGWSLDLPRYFSFLFPFEVRYAFLQSTSFGYHRLINKWQNLQSRNQEPSTSSSSNSRHDDSLALLGRLTRQKVRISRNNILASAFKVFELYGTNTSLLEVEYFDEVGTGLGPTLEFYALVSKEFARRDLNLWRSDDDAGSKGEYVFSSTGLFPAPCEERIETTEQSAKGKTKIQAFKVLGQFVAKALFDSRIVDLHFSTAFMRAVIHQSIPVTLSMLKTVDATLAHSLEKIKKMSAEELDTLGLDFTLPGHSKYELHEGGKDEAVTRENVESYVEEVIHHTLVEGVAPFVDAFRQGFSMIFSISAMKIFTAEELVMLFGNNEEDWSESTLKSSVKPDHGYNVDSATFQHVISLMSEFNITERREFLQWLTGSPKLPIGGFAGLHPQLTIVKRPPEANVDPDKTLPSVMTCVNFCKLPPFSTKAIMKERLTLAMREGQASFHLS